MSELNSNAARNISLLAKSKRQPYSGHYRLEADDTPPTTPTQADGMDNSDPALNDGRVEAAGDGNLSPEERTYKKRYGDLRTLQQKESNQFQSTITKLTGRITELEQRGSVMPKSAEEVKEWMEEFPDLTGVILNLAQKEVKEGLNSLQDQIDVVKEQSLEVLREKAYLRLQKLHPDVEDIRASTEFHEWVEGQPEAIQNWFYENDTDHVLAARGLDLFKAETGWGAKRPKRKNADVENSMNVPAHGSPVPTTNPTGKKTWLASEIQKLKPKDFEKFEAEIEAAMLEGRVINDTTRNSKG